MKYQENRKRAITNTVGSTKTDQSQAGATDINIIMRNVMIHGTAPGSAHPPIYGDFSEIPDNLRDMIELGRSIDGHRQSLPAGLRDMTVEELISTPPDQLQQRIEQESTYIQRFEKLPPHLKSLSKQDILQMPEKEFNAMIAPRNPETSPAPQEPKK